MAKEPKAGKVETVHEGNTFNKFQSVILAARRARELNQGIDVTQEMEGRKITSIAIEELESGKLKLRPQEGEPGEGKEKEED